MALTASNPFLINSKAPDFSLLDTVSNEVLSLDQLKGTKGTVVMFICNHCPFVIHVNPQLVEIANNYLSQGIAFIAISSNNVVAYPQDSPTEMKRLAKELNYPFPYLFDEDQSIAKAYDAACTPDFYLFDQDLRSVYHGQLDGSRPGNKETLSGKDLRAAINALLMGKPALEVQMPSIGCGIKWK